ncbi:MAG: hypothetical protein IPO60_18110 [Flavobacteriales bacterium]|nr:hypothetical protein [Flavobacteriales bacterium]
MSKKNKTTKKKEAASFDYLTFEQEPIAGLTAGKGFGRARGRVDRDDRALAERGVRWRDGSPPGI